MGSAGPVAFPQADEELAATLDNLDGADNYAEWVFELIEPYLGRRILEVGAGHGTFTQKLAAGDRHVLACDLSGRCVSHLTDRFAGDARVEVRRGSIEDVADEGPFDTVVLINVLEHIADDDTALRRLCDCLHPGGHLLLWVPALPVLYSDFDRRIGHYRRYRLGGLLAQLDRAGLRAEDLRYVNAVGALAWLVLARALRATPTAGTPVRIFDRWFVPVLRRMEDRLGRVPLGQSLFAAARRPEV